MIKNKLEPKVSIRKLEEMAANGHVALNVMQYDGWLLRFSNGYTFRANSVSILYAPIVDAKREGERSASGDVGSFVACGTESGKLVEKVEFCEKQYKKQGLPCVFKVTEEDRAFSDFLESRGYEVITPSYIMVLNDLALATPTELASDALQACSELSPFAENETSSQQSYPGEIQFWETPAEWLPSYFKIHEITDFRDQKTFREMLDKVLVDTIYCSLSYKGKVAACASAAIEDGYMLLQNVIVSKEFRGHGLGEKICRSIIAKAGENGAHHAYLQVLQTNDIALNLYEKIGFQKVYSYWYMKK